MTLSEAARDILFCAPNLGTGYRAISYYLALYDIQAHDQMSDPNKIAYNLLAVTPTTDERVLLAEARGGARSANLDARIVALTPGAGKGCSMD